ncbi:hypothetical protein [Streptomyces sp. MZ04]|uniref:hypothetical protein n=1 Tax=Streptomyces sp. MZ04 TaxID=2559236 RepID=UPI0014330C7C|nr:hypothetical protein [Streptomyces sp. MZ04]
MTSPANELRTAAEKLRALAAAASTATATPIDKGGTPTDRWHFTERERGSGYLYAANPDGPGTRLIHGSGGRRDYPHMRTRHGAYTAVMDPTVGLALADWLDAEARGYEAASHLAELHDGHIQVSVETNSDGSPCYAYSALQQALTVARAINGGKP